MDLRSIKSRIDRLLDELEPEGPPTCVIVLPDCGHGPDGDDRPFPRMNRAGQAAVIIYDPSAGAPSSEEIDRLVKGAP